MTQYLKLTTDIKAAIWYEYSRISNKITNFCFCSDADFKLAPFFDGYDRSRLDEHERELYVNVLICVLD